MTRTPLFGIDFDDIPMPEAAEAALRLIGRGGGAYAVTPNPEIVMAARKDPALYEAVTGADLVLPDGVGLVWASKILGKPLRNRLPGIDFASALMERLSKNGGSVYLLGAKPGVAEEAAKRLAAAYPGLRIAGTRHGYFRDDEEEAILGEIRAAGPDLILVCLGSSRQELWMKNNASRVGRGLMIGLGGATDVYAGLKKRAPEPMRRLGLEWLYRLAQEPKRIVRMVRLPGILFAAIKEKGRENA